MDTIESCLSKINSYLDSDSFSQPLFVNVNTLEETLRLGLRPIIGRIHEGKYLLDMRTLFEADFSTIVEALKEAVS